MKYMTQVHCESLLPDGVVIERNGGHGEGDFPNMEDGSSEYDLITLESRPRAIIENAKFDLDCGAR